MLRGEPERHASGDTGLAIRRRELLLRRKLSRLAHRMPRILPRFCSVNGRCRSDRNVGAGFRLCNSGVPPEANTSFHHLLQLLGGAKLRGDLGGNLDLLAGARVDALAGRAARNLEYAETGDLDLFALDHHLGDVIEHQVHHFLSLLLRAADVVGDELGKPLFVCFGHMLKRR